MIQVRTRRAPNLRNGRNEVWEATSTDGAWMFERADDSRTTWVVTHRDFPGWSATFGSLTKARHGAERTLGWDLAQALIRVFHIERPTMLISARSGRIAAVA